MAKDKLCTLYGDLVIALAFTIVTPIDGWRALTEDPNDNPKNTASNTVKVISIASCFLYCLLNWFAWIRNSNFYSRLAFSCGMWLCAFNNLSQWPYAGECVITPQFQGIVFGILSNLSIPFGEKIARMAVTFVIGSYVSIASPFSTYTEDVLPLVGGPIVLSIIFLVLTNFGIRMDLLSVWAVHGARLVLASIFIYETGCNVYNIKTDNAMDQLVATVKAAVVACVGVVATGIFQKEIDLKEQLEVQVRKRTKQLQEKNAALHMVNLALQASETAIAITDSNCCIIWKNMAFEKICNEISKTSLLNRYITDVLPLASIQDEDNLKIAFSSSCRTQDEIYINDSIFNLEVSPFSDIHHEGDKGTSDRFMVVFKNITADRARERAEKAAREEAMLAKAMGDSMVTLTHELRTPMQGIMGVTSMLISQGDDYLSKDVLDSLKLIMASSRLLLNLINNLLDVKKASAQMMDEFPLTPIAAAGPMKDTVDFCQPLASISSVKVAIDYGKAQNAIVKSNALRLQQVLINLVSNAIKYTSTDSVIHISIRAITATEASSMMDNSIASSLGASNTGENMISNSSDPVLLFSVSDCGPGIPFDQADRLFRRFARLDCSPGRSLGNNKIGQPTGTGLGLNLCQSFVRRMKGHIWATNNEDKGSTFSFYLPLISNFADPIPRQLSSRSMASSRTTQKQSYEDISVFRRRILLVDDVLINRKVLDRMLKRIGALKVVTVGSGHDALAELSKHQYDLVITDLQMPHMSGNELSKAIAAANLPKRPVVVGLTADTSMRIAEKCAESGMADVIYKPITVSEMRDYFETVVGHLQPGVWLVDQSFV